MPSRQPRGAHDALWHPELPLPCRPGPAARPYPSWTRRVNGKTVTRTLNTQQAERYRPLFDNSRRLRALIDELEDLSVGVVTRAEGWDPTAKE
jgi:hypothetical protein